MSMMDEIASDVLVKMLLIGDSKAGKTHYAAQIANAGFNVLYFDGDVARPTLESQLTPEGRKRVFYMDCADRVIGGNYFTRFADVVIDFCMSRGAYMWDTTLREPHNTAQPAPPQSKIAAINPASLDHNWVWVIDSWTTYSQSLKQWKAKGLQMDLGEVEQFGQELYAGVNNRADQVMQMIRGSKCHVLVIGHADVQEVWMKPNGSKGAVRQKDMILAKTQQVPASVSRPHGAKLGKNFTDVGWLIYRGAQRVLDFTGNADRVAGGHFTDKNLTPDSGAFDKLVRMINGTVPTREEADESLARTIKFYQAGEYEGTSRANALKPASAPAKVVASPAASGLSALMAKKSS